MHLRLLRRESVMRFDKYFAPPVLVVLVVLIATGSIFPARAQAQRRSTPAAALPSPRSVFGFNPGDDRTMIDWKQITDYLAQLDRASDRVQLQTIGTSTLGRTMVAAVISAPENPTCADRGRLRLGALRMPCRRWRRGSTSSCSS